MDPEWDGGRPCERNWAAIVAQRNKVLIQGTNGEQFVLTMSLMTGREKQPSAWWLWRTCRGLGSQVRLCPIQEGSAPTTSVDWCLRKALNCFQAVNCLSFLQARTWGA